MSAYFASEIICKNDNIYKQKVIKYIVKSHQLSHYHLKIVLNVKINIQPKAGS